MRLTLFPLLLAAFLSACNLPLQQAPADASAPASTSMPGITPLPTLAPTQPPTPTPQPIARIGSADEALFFGEWERALDEYTLALGQSEDPAVLAAAQIGLGRAHFANGDNAAALDFLRLAAQSAPDDAIRARAYFTLGRVFYALQRYTESAEAYNTYVTLMPGLIDYYAYLRRGNSLLAAGNYTEAVSAYQQAISAPHLGDALDINIKIGDAYSLMGDHATALIVYRDVRDRTTNDYTKSQMQLYIGQAHIALGQPELAYQAWSFAVTNYPVSYYTYLALIGLIEAGIPVSEFERGLVDYFVGRNYALSGQPSNAQTMYALAFEAFNRHLAEFPEDHTAALHFYRALSLQGLEDYPSAIADFDQLILTHQEENFWVDAWDEKAYTQWANLGDYTGAAQTLLDFITTSPTNARAPELLFRAGRILEISGDLENAAAVWSRVGVEYPQSEYASDAFFFAGIARYRLDRYTEALEDFRSSLVVSRGSSNQARSHFWSGKTLQRMGETGEATLSFQVAAATDPTGYYSERASDMLEGLPPFTPGVYDLAYDLSAERIEAAAWVINAFALPQDLDLLSPGPLASDPRFARAGELWQLGLPEDARLEFESLRQDVAFDPANTFRLANHLIDLGLYRSGIIAARQVLDLAGMDDAGTLKAPAYFNHVRFGAYYAPLVDRAAQIYSFDRLFFYSVMRQESLFEGFVSSDAGARGLMQILPSTAQGIATNLEWPLGYREEDLYRPTVSITFGADYLSAQRNYFDGDLYLALAAYNAGPGNAIAWRDLAAGDPDLFLEIIRFSETRSYIRGIYEIFSIYRDVYQKAPE